MSKGIVWVPVAIGIIFLAQILIFSLAFSQVTIYSREVVDANIVFEGDELETYARAVENSIQLSLAQGIYDFYMKNKGAEWQTTAGSSVPSAETVQDEVNGYANGYVLGFLESLQEFAAERENRIVIRVPVDFSSSVEVGKEDAKMKFGPELTIFKDFEGSTFTRSISAEASLSTAFGEMMEFVRDDLVGGDQIGNKVKAAIRRETKDSRDVCSVEIKSLDLSNPDNDRRKIFDGLGNGENDGRTLHSYLDEDLTPGDSEISGLRNEFGDGTQTQGMVRYCETREELMLTPPNSCACDDPCKGLPAYMNSQKLSSKLKSFGLDREPESEKVYQISHGQTYGSASEIIQRYARQRMVCLESELDDRSESYTVAFDGDSINKDGSLGPLKVETTGSVSATSCGTEPFDGSICEGVALRECGSCPLPGGGETTKYEWKCPYIYEKACSFGHYASGSAEVRVQEDGFVYGFNRDGSPVADNIKVVFTARSGNADLG